MAEIKLPGDQSEMNLSDRVASEVESKPVPVAEFPENSAVMSFLEWIHTVLTADSRWPHRGLSFREALAAVGTSFDTCPQAAKFAYYDSLDCSEGDILATFASSSICEGLKLIFQHPLLVMEVSPNFKRSLLHAFVAVSSTVAVQMLLSVVSSSDKRLEFLHAKEGLSGLTALEMARIIGNNDIEDMIARCEDGNAMYPPVREEAAATTTTTTTTRIGEVIRLHLEPLGFSDLPLKIRGLGDEFRLHVSLLKSDPMTRAAWASVKPTHVHYLLRIIIDELHRASLLPTFLGLRDASGRHIFHYMMDIADDGIFRTLMHAMEEHVKESACGHLLGAKDTAGRTPMHLAAAQGRIARVQHMCFSVPNSLDFNATFRVSGEDGSDVEGVSPLSLAVAHNQYEFVKYLLSSGKVDNLNERIVINKFELLGRFESSRIVRWTPLQLAAFLGHSRIVEKLLADNRVHVPSRVYFREGEKPIAEEKLLDTAPPMHLAAYRGKPNLVKRLLKQKRVSLLHQDMAGNTALHYAFWYNRDLRIHAPWMFTSIQECISYHSKPGNIAYNTSCCSDELREAAATACVDLDKPNLSGAKPEPITAHESGPFSHSWRATSVEKKNDKEAKVAAKSHKVDMEDSPGRQFRQMLDALNMNAPSEWLESLIVLFEMALHSPPLVMEASNKNSRTLLQMAVVANSVDLVTKVLMMMNDQRHFGAKVAVHFNKSELTSNMTAMDMASVIANPEVVHVMATYQNMFNATKVDVEKLELGDVQGDSSENMTVAKALAKFPTLPHPVSQDELQRRTEDLGISLGGDFFRQDLRLHKSLMLNDKKVRTGWEELMMSPQSPPTNTCTMVGSVEQPTELHKHGSFSGLLNGIAFEMASVLPELLSVRDRAGRHLLHYLANLEPGDGTPQGNLRDTIFDTLMDALMKGGYHLDMNVRDSAGRTPLHLAAAQGFTRRVEFFANQPTTDLNATFSVRSLSAGVACKAVHNISALSLAATHNHSKVVQALLAAKNGLDVNAPVLKILLQKGSNRYEESCVAWSPLQIASLKGHVETLTKLLQNEQVTYSKLKVSTYHELLEKYGASKSTFDKTLSRASPLHLAALGRRSCALTTLLESGKADLFALDDDLNTPLHYAARVSCSTDTKGPWDYVSIQLGKENVYVKKMPYYGGTGDCTTMLVEAGLDPGARNKRGESAEDHGMMRRYEPFRYKRQTTMSAVPVTSAIVAATAFVRPFHDMGQSDNHGAAELFMFFDTLSFYFAIAAIMLTLIPSLAGRQEASFRQMKRAQRYSQGAAVLLFASITLLICSFGAASAVAVPAEKRKRYVDMVLSSTALGGAACFVASALFLRGLWRLAKSELRGLSSRKNYEDHQEPLIPVRSELKHMCGFRKLE